MVNRIPKLTTLCRTSQLRFTLFLLLRLRGDSSISIENLGGPPTLSGACAIQFGERNCAGLAAEIQEALAKTEKQSIDKLTFFRALK